MDEAIAAVEDEPPLDERTETWYAINGYRAALTYIMQAANDNYFEFSKQFLKSLHFMMTGFDLNAYPGQWRPGAVYVVNKSSGEVVYTPPDVEQVDSLVRELVDYLVAQPYESSAVKAAMAHLNLTMIHPFKDGNGRMARALQTLVLAREGILHPLFSSIEEWLGQNTEEYYAILAQVGKGGWHPQNDALSWVRFCLKAHYQQAATLIRRNEEYENLFDFMDQLVEKRNLNHRVSMPLFDLALGLRMTNSRYQREAEVTQYVASRDLKQLCDAGLIEPRGENRGRFYVAGPILREARTRFRRKRTVSDPYTLSSVADRLEPRFPGV
jgi:Fic family protein